MSHHVEANLIIFWIQHAMRAVCDQIYTAYGHNLKLAAVLSRI
jgi:hypothetical protein